MRLFVAIDVPDSVKDFFSEFNKELIKIEGVKKTYSKKLHLTLDFYNDEDLDKVLSKVYKITQTPFFLETDKYGFFPNKENIKVVWLGVKSNSSLNSLLEQLDVKEEFIPHITIARCKNMSDKNKEKLLKTLKKPEIKFKVSSIKVYSSKLTPFGPIHTLQQSFKL